MIRRYILLLLLPLTVSCHTAFIQTSLQGEYKEKRTLFRDRCVALSSDNIKVSYFLPNSHCLTAEDFSTLQGMIPESYKKTEARISYYNQDFNRDSCIGLFYLDYRKYISKNEVRITSAPCIKLKDKIIVNFQSEMNDFNEEEIAESLESYFDYHTIDFIIKEFTAGKIEYIRDKRIIDVRALI